MLSTKSLDLEATSRNIIVLLDGYECMGNTGCQNELSNIFSIRNLRLPIKSLRFKPL